jgi:predicted DNA binding CopG/RHH family protein
MKLTKQEHDLLASIERGEWRQSGQPAATKKQLQAAARATVRKDKRVNIRMTARDLVHLQKAALEEGLPYQTLIASILHKYITGRLVERPRSKGA